MGTAVSRFGLFLDLDMHVYLQRATLVSCDLAPILTYAFGTICILHVGHFAPYLVADRDQHCGLYVFLGMRTVRRVALSFTPYTIMSMISMKGRLVEPLASLFTVTAKRYLLGLLSV